VWFLWEEWDIVVNQSTVSRVLNRLRINNKLAQRMGHRQNAELRIDWELQMLHLTAEQLVFVDESLFNESTGWRYRAYAPVGRPARYHASRRRGHSWGVLPAYTVDGYLPCTAIKEGWFNADDFFEWIVNELLPYCNPFPGPRSIIIMDNASFHCHPRIAEAIREHGCDVRFLPPYSPDFNPIELSFSVLKAWFRRYFDYLWPQFDGTFGDFLRYAVNRSRCDRFAREHFRHAGGYIFEADVRQLEERMLAGDIQIDFE